MTKRAMQWADSLQDLWPVRFLTWVLQQVSNGLHPGEKSWFLKDKMNNIMNDVLWFKKNKKARMN
jgi:hypothetical protein